jgi:hypothetical protein
MKMSPASFNDEFHDRMLDLLWRHWTTMGVAGQVAPVQRVVLDPEALLLVSCTVARHDPRLFDAILDWLKVNGRHLNIQRLQRMRKAFQFDGGRVYAAVAASASTAERQAKWARSAKPAKSEAAAEPLFLLDRGHALPMVREPDPAFLAHGFLRDPYFPRDTARPFPAGSAANLLLRLRALLGINARCEILAYLLLNGHGSPRAIARACGYFPATVTKALSDMSGSGYLSSRTEGRIRHYSLVSDAWCPLLVGQNHLRWVNWAPLFSALEQAWLFLHAEQGGTQSPLAQASNLRRLLRSSLMDRLAIGGLPLVLGDYTQHPGEALLLYFSQLMRRVLDAMANLE